jgi:hypothetical protein
MLIDTIFLPTGERNQKYKELKKREETIDGIILHEQFILLEKT